MKLTLVQLEYLVALDTHRHFAKAADACFVTQPTLSMQIQKLEDSLNIKLFDRSKQPVVPTEIGKKIIEQARLVISEAKRIDELIEEEKSEVKGELHVGVIPTIAPYLLPHFIGQFIKEYPHIKLIIHEMLTDEVVAALRNEAIDIGIVATPLKTDQMQTIPLYYEEFFAFLHPRSALLKKEHLQTTDLLDERLWLLTEGHCFREQVIQICQQAEAQEQHNFEYQSGSLEALKNMVMKQGGATLLPELATLELSKAEKELIRPFNTPAPLREVSLIMRRTFLKKRQVDALKKQINEHLPTIIKLKDANRGQVVLW
jgi:LysR family transcriptional regulator, hydrogen peroxide-inducible genes activator